MPRRPGPVALAAALLLGGCIPWPHRELLAPEISGVIRRGQEPLAPTRVYLDVSNDSRCTSPALAAKTDSAGAFEIGPVKSELRWLVLLFGDPVVRWRLCVDTVEGRRVLMHQGGIGMPPPRLEVACTVAASAVTRIDAFGTIEGFCKGRPVW
jgi:hypothetical protein